jgi:mannose-6-phosphate isomerase-like protein (cupin superfamily)
MRTVLTKKGESKNIKIGGTTISAMLPEDVIKDALIEVAITTVEPGTETEWTDGRGPFVHTGEEFWYVLKGELEAKVGEESYRLVEGDLLYLDGMKPHMYRNIGKTEAKLFQGCSPPEGIRVDYYEHLDPQEWKEAIERRSRYEKIRIGVTHRHE